MKTSLDAPESTQTLVSWSDVLRFHNELLERTTGYVEDCIKLRNQPSVEDYESWKQVQNDLEKKAHEESQDVYQKYPFLWWGY